MKLNPVIEALFIIIRWCVRNVGSVHPRVHEIPTYKQIRALIHVRVCNGKRTGVFHRNCGIVWVIMEVCTGTTPQFRQKHRCALQTIDMYKRSSPRIFLRSLYISWTFTEIILICFLFSLTWYTIVQIAAAADHISQLNIFLILFISEYAAFKLGLFTVHAIYWFVSLTGS